MFGNFAAQAGVVSLNASTSPNLITPTLNWNFNDVIVFDFSPPGVENINDRPRLNVFRSVDGVPDFNYLRFVSGGQKLLSPSPTGKVLEPWGDRRTGEIRFSTTSIGNQIIAGVDLFTHPFALPVNISPPLNEWTIDSTSVPGEIKYQYQFIVGQKNPQININLQYNPTCVANGSVTLPNCSQSQYTVYVGTGSNGCPIYICENIASLIERGSLYNIDTWSGNGVAGFGTWLLTSGIGTLRNISDSTQLNRQSIGSESFFIVGSRNSFSSIPHDVNFNLKTGLRSGDSLSIDANYAWFDGSRIISFTGSNSKSQYEFIHAGSDALRYNRTAIVNGSNEISNLTITGNAFQKAFTYKATNLGTGFLMQVYQYESTNILYSDIVTGNNIDWNNFVRGITCTAFIGSPINVPIENWFNYGIYFNNITYIPSEFNNKIRLNSVLLDGCLSDVLRTNVYVDSTCFLGNGCPVYLLNNQNNIVPYPDGSFAYPSFGSRQLYTVQNGIVISTTQCP